MIFLYLGIGFIIIEIITFSDMQQLFAKKYYYVIKIKNQKLYDRNRFVNLEKN